MNWETWRKPAGWTLYALTDVADVTMGQSPPGTTYNTNGNGLPFFQGKTEFGPDHPTVRKWCTAPTRMAEPGDILMSVRAPVGPTNIADQRCSVGRGLAVIHPKNNIPGVLLRYAIMLQEDEIASWGTGTTFTAISKRHFQDIAVPLPPVKERESLAKLLDASVTLRRSSSAHLLQAHLMIERIRHSILAAACDSRLTSTWRDSNTSRNMNRLLMERGATGERKTRRGVILGAPLKPLLADMDLPETWARITVSRALVLGAFEDVKDGNHGANHPKVSEFTAEGLPFIAANLVHDGMIDFNTAPRVSGKTLERLRIGFAKANDVILTHKGSVGRVAISDRDCVLTPQTTYYRCDSSLILPEYLAIYLQSLYFYLQLAEGMSQTTRDFVPISDQYLLGLILPPPEEQLEVVRRVTRLLTLTRTVGRRIDLTLRQVERSSQAVLAKAFRGELTSGEVAPEANIVISSGEAV